MIDPADQALVQAHLNMIGKNIKRIQEEEEYYYYNHNLLLLDELLKSPVRVPATSQIWDMMVYARDRQIYLDGSSVHNHLGICLYAIPFTTPLTNKSLSALRRKLSSKICFQAYPTAFLMGGHKRLGKKSPALGLPDAVMDLIVSHVLHAAYMETLSISK
jgi:hypothetical protein